MVWCPCLQRGYQLGIAIEGYRQIGFEIRETASRFFVEERQREVEPLVRHIYTDLFFDIAILPDNRILGIVDISISDEMIQFGILHIGIQYHEVTVDLVRIQMIQCRQLVFHTIPGTQVYRQMFGPVLLVSPCTFHIELSAKKEGGEYAQDESRRGERIGIKKKEQARQPDLLFPL